ncbi:hypothetical protein SPF06_21440 [Sinomonas sp. JGH33]|uniref:Uncharacterized protein n=1 Tax=Sinomonas terricola TaxID=3110330 RepID=A0ABU5TCS3_9MICC|nr:hypothetical protein [Sinomonas sp. JGH33]MEA5457289.1 hypothetical protein [Sinomonas sp. JGH33]
MIAHLAQPARYSSPDLGEQVASWIAHSAIWHLTARLPLPLLIVVGIAAVGWIAYRRSRRG